MIELMATLAISGIVAGVSFGTYYGLKKKQSASPKSTALVRDAFEHYVSTCYQNARPLLEEGQSFVSDYLPSLSFYHSDTMKVNFAYVVQDKYVSSAGYYETVLDSDAGLLFLVEENGKSTEFSYFLADYSGVSEMSPSYATEEELYQNLNVPGYHVGDLKLRQKEALVLDDQHQIITSSISYPEGEETTNTLLVPNGQSVLQCAYAEKKASLFSSLETKSFESVPVSAPLGVIGGSSASLMMKFPIYQADVLGGQMPSVLTNVSPSADLYQSELMKKDVVKVTNVFTAENHIPVDLYCPFEEAYSYLNDAANRMNSHLLYIGNDVTLSAGKRYVIPEKTQVLIGYDVKNLKSGFEKEHIAYQDGFLNFHPGRDTTPSSLTLAEGSELLVKGKLVLASQYQSSTEKDGVSYGVYFKNQGKLTLNEKATITLSYGAQFEAYAPVIGKGTVVAKEGSRVVDLLTVEDYLGAEIDRGIAAATFYGDKNFGTFGKTVLGILHLGFVDDLLSSFPFNKISARNFEVPLEVEAGADYVLEANLFCYADQDKSKETFVKIGMNYYQEWSDTFSLIGKPTERKNESTFDKKCGDSVVKESRRGTDTLFVLDSGKVCFLPENGKKTMRFVNAKAHDSSLVLKPLMVRSHISDGNVGAEDLGKVIEMNLLDLCSTTRDGSMQTMALPMYHVHFVLDGSSSLEIGNHPFKFLPGSKMTLEENASLLAGEKIFFYRKDDFNRKESRFDRSKINEEDAYLDLPHQFTLTDSSRSGSAQVYGEVKMFRPASSSKSVGENDYQSSDDPVKWLSKEGIRTETKYLLYERVEYNYVSEKGTSTLKRFVYQDRQKMVKKTRLSRKNVWKSNWVAGDLISDWTEEGSLELGKEALSVQDANEGGYLSHVSLDLSASAKVYGYDRYQNNIDKLLHTYEVPAAYIQVDTLQAKITYK